MMALKNLMKIIGYHFKRPGLLQIAMTHRSYAVENNERIEFLGDSILNFIIGEYLFQKFPLLDEGELSRLRASLVRGETLALMANEMQISQYILLGSGEIKTHGAERRSTLANVMEAIIGAIYLDAGMEKCREVVLKWYQDRLTEDWLTATEKDPKSRLQEYMQAKKLALPVYELRATQGKAHKQTFEVACKVEGFEFTGIGKDYSKRRAEQAAAEQFLNWLAKHDA